MDRTVTGHIPLSLDGRVSGPGGEPAAAKPAKAPKVAKAPKAK